MIIIIVTFRNEVTYSCHLEIQKLKCSSKLSNYVHLSRISRRPRSLIGHLEILAPMYWVKGFLKEMFKFKGRGADLVKVLKIAILKKIVLNHS